MQKKYVNNRAYSTKHAKSFALFMRIEYFCGKETTL